MIAVACLVLGFILTADQHHPSPQTHIRRVSKTGISHYKQCMSMLCDATAPFNPTKPLLICAQTHYESMKTHKRAFCSYHFLTVFLLTNGERCHLREDIITSSREQMSFPPLLSAHEFTQILCLHCKMMPFKSHKMSLQAC